MIARSDLSGRLSAIFFFLIALRFLSGVSTLFATDFFLTIGGGYDRSGNQASLEANVLFFQQLLTNQHRGQRQHDIFLADGNDPTADLQVLADRPIENPAPATALLDALHRRRGDAAITYRNHQVAPLAGPLDPALIRTSLETAAKTAKAPDRLIIYVTAHGSAGPKTDPFNTTIDCWSGQKITAREFTEWLNKLPADIPVVMVMAQCYCGGFSHAILENFDKQAGLATQLRAGFFAQQHDLPAAGCRPDIEHDEEFSSFFWGALAGRSRNGVPINGCDIDGDGLVSFAEAYAYAVTAGETIDIPLRTSDVLLRTFSRLPADEPNVSTQESESPPGLLSMSGTLETIADKGHPVSRQIVIQLSKSLGFSLKQDVSAVRSAYEESRRLSRMQGRRGPRQASGRREVLREVGEKWPELGDERKWKESPLLTPENQQPLLAELKQLPSWATYDDRRHQLEIARKESEQQELRAVKFRKLINALESIVLEANLPLSATPNVVVRYRQLLALEETSLSAEGTNK